MLENYPTLHAADLVNAWAYADTHPEEIEQAQRVAGMPPFTNAIRLRTWQQEESVRHWAS